MSQNPQGRVSFQKSWLERASIQKSSDSQWWTQGPLLKETTGRQRGDSAPAGGCLWKSHGRERGRYCLFFWVSRKVVSPLSPSVCPSVQPNTWSSWMNHPSLLQYAFVSKGSRKMEGPEGDPICTENQLSVSPKNHSLSTGPISPSSLWGYIVLVYWRHITLVLQDTVTGLFWCRQKGNQPSL